MNVENQQGDVLLFQTNDDGNIIVEDGLVRMSGGLATAAYLSLFGGNQDDDGRDDSLENWWANFSEIDSDKHYRSETQNLLTALPLSTGNLRRIENAAMRDLAWFVAVGAATSVDVTATIPRLNTVALNVRIVADGSDSKFQFVENWKADLLPQVPITDEGIASEDISFILAEDSTFILAEDGSKIRQE